MATVSNTFQTGNHAGRPTSGLAYGALYACTTHQLIYQTTDGGGTWVTWATLGAATTVATDTIWAAKGDIVGATGNDAAAVLTAGANDTILMADSAASNGLKWVASATPSTQAFGDSAAVGTGDTFTRGDHKHAMPTAAVTTSGLTQATGKMLGRSTASTGAIEEITVGSGLTLSGGSLSASGSSAVPGWIGKFIGTTDSTHFYWDGNDLASFTAQTVTGSATWTEGNNLASALVSNQTADDAAAQLIAQTISIGDSWELAIHSTILASDSGGSTAAYRGLGILFTDGTGTTANCVIGHIQQDNGGGGGGALLVGRHGTLTNINSGAPWVSNGQGIPSFGGWIWVKLKYSAANTFQLFFGDGVSYSAFGEADISKTMTPTHVGLFTTMPNAGTMVASFGPLLKV